MPKHRYDGDPTQVNPKCKECSQGFDADEHMDHVFTPGPDSFESFLLKGPDGVVVWVSSVLGSTSVQVYENMDHNPTLSYDSHNHRRRQAELDQAQRNARDWRSRANEGPRYAIDMD